MRISAQVINHQGAHDVNLSTNDRSHAIDIPPKESGRGSSANGGELLFLALGTCYCNDLYREAAKRGIEVESVQVQVEGDFGAEGEPASRIRYRASVAARASESEILALMEATDRVAEIQNTLRQGMAVILEEARAIPL